ncbi:hypothetical protein D9619_006279 [Psilocybe cf. subviscida]|uniref:F-box domain-containing protein n=1 Tax=Psilocybe cf. subviscida TaxID=2480587 RepID=A0A8H5B447_9AGAR|nr:hypothetical protein D9619_006279 [Psilocybe cf. subviscida]
MSVDLPTDIFKVIIGFLDLRDVYAIKLVCREFHDLTKTRALWSSLVRRYVLNQCLPIPGLRGKVLDQLSAPELEQCLCRALRLRRNWVSPLPAIVNRLTLPGIIPKTRIVSMHLIPNHERALLLSLSMQTSPTRKFTLQCWDIEARPPVRLAAYECNRFRGSAVNKESRNGERVIAVLDPHLHILSLDDKLTSEAQDGRFVTTAVFPDETNTIQLFSGSSLLCRGNNGTMHLLDIDSPNSRIHLQSPHQASPVLDVVITSEYILVLRSTHLEFYAITNHFPDNAPSVPTPNSPTAPTLHPLFIYQWQWRIDNAGMTIRRSVPGSTLRTPISILLRYGSYFPWAINILHHYDLQPNHNYIPDSPTTQTNLPFEFPPVLRETIGSPVRLHATSDMAIGSYGTAIWTDSHTEDFYGHADRGQRVAGRFSRRNLRPSGSVKVEREREGEGLGTGVPEEEDEEGEDVSDQVASAVATSVYVHQEEDSWVRIALDETEGRIFLGRDDGCIEVLEYI